MLKCSSNVPIDPFCFAYIRFNKIKKEIEPIKTDRVQNKRTTTNIANMKNTHHMFKCINKAKLK